MLRWISKLTKGLLRNTLRVEEDVEEEDISLKQNKNNDNNYCCNEVIDETDRDMKMCNIYKRNRSNDVIKSGKRGRDEEGIQRYRPLRDEKKRKMIRKEEEDLDSDQRTIDKNKIMDIYECDNEETDDKYRKSKRKKDKRKARNNVFYEDSDKVKPYKMEKEAKPFNPEQTDFLDYIVYFKIVSEWNGWDDKEKAQQLLMSLEGEAMKLLSYLPEKTLESFEKLEVTMRDIYQPKERAYLYKIEFRTRRQKEGEATSKYAQELHRLFMRAYPNMQEVARETFVLDQFVFGLANHQMREHVCFQHPKSMKEALAHAMEFESFEMGEEKRRGMSQEDFSANVSTSHYHSPRYGTVTDRDTKYKRKERKYEHKSKSSSYHHRDWSQEREHINKQTAFYTKKRKARQAREKEVILNIVEIVSRKNEEKNRDMERQRKETTMKEQEIQIYEKETVLMMTKGEEKNEVDTPSERVDEETWQEEKDDTLEKDIHGGRSRMVNQLEESRNDPPDKCLKSRT